MKDLCIACVVIMLLASCSVPLRVADHDPAMAEKGEARLLNIRIDRWGDLRFSGLLALRHQDGGLYYALLDATGVKLLEVTVGGDGAARLLHAKGGLRESGLDGFLAEVLSRIYLQEPAALPCSGTWLYQLCREENVAKSGWRKYGQSGPLEIWQATAEGGEELRGGVVEYRQPWIGVRILLEPAKTRR